MTNSTNSTGFVPGLAGVVAAQTRLSSVNGLEGELIIAGFPLEEIASQATFEEVAYLLWNDALPTSVELDKFRKALAAERVLPSATTEILQAAAQYQLPPMDALLLAASTLRLDLAKNDPPHQAISVLARFPMMVATYARLSNGQKTLSPSEDLGQAANYLYMLFGEIPLPDSLPDKISG